MKRGVRLVGLLAVCAMASGELFSISAQAPGARVRLDVAQGTKASFRVREQLAGYDLPNDAVGTTEAVSGSLVLAPDGTFDRERSKLAVDLNTLKSDQSMRDNYLRGRTLETEKFPTAVFVPRRVQGLALPLATSGKTAFQFIGDLTVHGVTKELTWNVTGTFAPDRVTGQASTTFPFSTFGLQIPKLARLLSVEDKIQLELDFTLNRTALP